MLKLKRLKIEKYRSVKPGTELHFRDSLNVLLGRNGTGKTTLLNLVVQLLSWDFSQMQEESVDLEYELCFSEEKMLVRVRSDSLQESSNPLPGSIGFAGAVTALGVMSGDSRYSLSLEISAFADGVKLGLLRVEGPKIDMEDGQGNSLDSAVMNRIMIGKRTLSGLAFAISFLPSPRLELRETIVRWFGFVNSGQIMSLRRFDESLGYLEYVAQEVKFVATKRPFSFKVNDYGVVSSEEIVALNKRLEKVLSSDPDADGFKLGSGEEGAAFLDRLVELLDCRSAQIRIQRSSRTPGPVESIDFENIRFDFVRRDGSLVNHTQLSYGQKRLLAFYFYLAANPAFVVADELVNGMHHEWIEACLEDLGDRQSFLTSQNPLLLDYLAFESVEEVQDSFVLCRTELHEDQEQWVWENMSDADADGFFKAYRVAIQHVSELLRTRGLW